MSAKPVPIFSGVITPAGVLKLDARELFHRYVKTLSNQPITLVVKRLTRRKSTQQLGYLWGVLYPVIAEHFGYCDYEHEAMHDELMRVLCGLKAEPNPLKIRVSLAEMTHEDVSAYISDLRFWAMNEHGIITPDSDRVEVPAAKTRAA